MDFIEFQKFVVSNPNHQFNETLQKAARYILKHAPVESLTKLSVGSRIKEGTLSAAISRFQPFGQAAAPKGAPEKEDAPEQKPQYPLSEVPEDKLKQIEDLRQKQAGLWQRQQPGPSAESQVSAHLGDAYVTTIDQVAGQLSWFGEGMMLIGREAFLGFLMAQGGTPDEIRTKLMSYTDVSHVYEDFRGYYNSLMLAKTEAGTIDKLKHRNEELMVLVALAEDRIEKITRAYMDITKMLGMATVMLRPDQIQRLWLARFVDRFSLIGQPKPVGQPESPREGVSS